VPAGSGGLVDPNGLLFGGDGNLYVAGFVSNNVLRYDGTTGAFVDTFVPPFGGGLTRPTHMTFTNTKPTTPAYAIPEPSSLALLGLGTLGWLGYAWRRRKPAGREGG